MSTLFSSSVGKKLLMSLAGMFLLIFLIVHLGINLLVLLENPMYYNKAAHFMGTSILIRIMEIVLFGGLFLHMIYSVIVNLVNWEARPIRYIKPNNSQTSFFSKYMIHTAFVITIFLILHLIDFWVKVRFTGIDPVDVIYDGKSYHDLATLVTTRFKIGWVVIAYEVTLLGLGFHLNHGFQSAFQTLGFNHPVYTPVIKAAGLIYSVVITIGFMCIPVLVYYFK
jgi:succinate dehydrogenase / fumarate reductase, cytochrome b subunit